MAKTIFVDGSILTPTFMDTSFGNSAITGHRHTGQNDDGSQPLVRPALEFVGSIDPDRLVPDTNLNEELLLDVDASFDGGSTWPVISASTLLKRAGKIVTLRNNSVSLSGTIGGVDNPITLRRTDLNPAWPINFFGFSDFLSACAVTIQSGVFVTGHMFFESSGSTLTIHPTSGIGEYVSTAVVSVPADVIFCWQAV